MRSAYIPNKKLLTKWADYQEYDSEPKYREKYDISPELEDELLDSGYFLKARVRRNMKKIRRQAAYSNSPNPNFHHWKCFKHA